MLVKAKGSESEEAADATGSRCGALIAAVTRLRFQLHADQGSANSFLLVGHSSS